MRANLKSPIPLPELKAEKLLFSGAYERLLREYFDLNRRRLTFSSAVPVICSLASLGRKEESLACYKKCSKGFTVEQNLQVRFFLGLAALRISDFESAKDFMFGNELQNNFDERTGFFFHQARAIYFFYIGEPAEEMARKSLAFSIAGEFLYGRVLACDLLAHIELQKGNKDSGLKKLALALQLAKFLGNAGLVAAISSSLLIEETQLGNRGAEETIAVLIQHLKNSAIEDVYTQANIWLEIARHQILSGKWNNALQSLHLAGKIIYSFGLKKQEASLNLMYAHLNFHQGKFSEALVFVRSAKINFSIKSEHPICKTAFGMEEKIRIELGLPFQTSPLSAYRGEYINQRIELRLYDKNPKETIFSFDRIGNLMDQAIEKSEKSIPSIIESGYLGLLAHFVRRKHEKLTIAIDLIPFSVTLFGEHGIFYFPLNQKRITRKILLLLIDAPRSRAELISMVWSYDYHPLRHDSLLNTAIGSLRKLFGIYSDWIELTENGYSLKPNIHVVNPDLGFSREFEVKKRQEFQHPNLNHRQVQILTRLKGTKFMNVNQYQKWFKVSKVTATRDLSELVKLNFMNKFGRARATHYAKGTLP